MLISHFRIWILISNSDSKHIKFLVYGLLYLVLSVLLLVLSTLLILFIPAGNAPNNAAGHKTLDHGIGTP